MSTSPSFKQTVRIPLAFVAIMWLVFLVELIPGLDFSTYGINPRTMDGLRGIFTAPFIHGDWGHLANNSLPMLLLGMGIYYFYRPVALRIYIFSILITGLWVWAFARPSFHIGASGVVYSFAAFVFVSGFLRRNFRLIALSLLVVFQYGGMIWGVLPITEGVSWESHLLGGLTGVMLAYYYREIGRVEKKYDWEDEEDEPEFDDWKLPEQRHQEPIYRYIYKVKSEDDTKPKA